MDRDDMCSQLPQWGEHIGALKSEVERDLGGRLALLGLKFIDI
jgi:hypothetical protein